MYNFIFLFFFFVCLFVFSSEFLNLNVIANRSLDFSFYFLLLLFFFQEFCRYSVDIFIALIFGTTDRKNIRDFIFMMNSNHKLNSFFELVELSLKRKPTLASFFEVSD